MGRSAGDKLWPKVHSAIPKKAQQDQQEHTQSPQLAGTTTTTDGHGHTAPGGRRDEGDQAFIVRGLAKWYHRRGDAGRRSRQYALPCIVGHSPWLIIYLLASDGPSCLHTCWSYAYAGMHELDAHAWPLYCVYVRPACDGAMWVASHTLTLSCMHAHMFACRSPIIRW
jgi:hypothetical protein